MTTYTEKLIALLALTGASTAIGIAMKLSQVKGKYSYSPMSAVTMTESFKLAASVAIIGRLIAAGASEKHVDCQTEAQSFARENYSYTLVAHNVGLAIAYAIVNLVTFGIFIHAPASSFFLLKAASPVVTALMLALLVKRPISTAQWAAILGQCVGLAATQYDPCSSSTSLNSTAYFFIFVNIAVSCGAGVWNEHVIKTYGTSVNAQNSMMYSCGALVNFFLFLVLSPESIGGPPGLGFFDGYNGAVMAVIAANGSVGLIITAVYKYADVVVKTFGMAGSTVLLFMLEAIGVLPGANKDPRAAAIIGSTLVFYASYVYIAPPLMEAAPTSPAQQQQPSDLESGKLVPAERPVPVARNVRALVIAALSGCALFATYMNSRLCG